MQTQRTPQFSRFSRAAATVAVAGLALTACGGDGGGGGGTINLAINHGWEEGIAVAELWAVILEDEGYTVDKTYMDLAPSFSGLQTGDIDLNMNIWQPVTHESYLEEYGDDIEQVGVWNSDAEQMIAVNADAPIDSLEELADNADLFDKTLVGIEPGAGLTERVTNNLMPAYGVEDWELKTSSTPAMLQELDTALSNGENIAVTLWSPHWAFAEYDIKALEDPQEALGLDEKMTIYSRTGFADDFPEVKQWLADFEIDTETLEDLERVLFVDEADQSEYEFIIRDWIDENQEWVDTLTP